jgi:hypothetical protein
VTRGRIALVCAVAGLTMVAGYAVEDIIYNCKPPVDPLPVHGVIPASVTLFAAKWCGPPAIASLPIMIVPWLVATYLLARREAIVPSFGSDGSGITIGWFACVCMGLMWWLGFLAFVVPWVPFSAEDTLLRFAVVGGAIAVPVIGFLTALVGSAIQVFIRWGRRKRLPQAA